MNLSRILVGCDFSGPAESAFLRAVQLGAEHGAAHIEVVHVLSQSSLEAARQLVRLPGEELVERITKDARARLDAMIQRSPQTHGFTVGATVAVGNAVAELCSTAEQQSSDLVVMGARGSNFVRELMLGSTTERVLRKIARPLLAVKRRPHGPYERVLAAFDESTHAGAALEMAVKLAPQSEIRVLRAVELPFEDWLDTSGLDEELLHRLRVGAKAQAREDLRAFVQRSTPDHPLLSSLVVHGPAAHRILEQEQAFGADLIVMGKRGLSVMEALFLGSVTKHVLAYSECDVLIGPSA